MPLPSDAATALQSYTAADRPYFCPSLTHHGDRRGGGGGGGGRQLDYCRRAAAICCGGFALDRHHQLASGENVEGLSALIYQRHTGWESRYTHAVSAFVPSSPVSTKNTPPPGAVAQLLFYFFSLQVRTGIINFDQGRHSRLAVVVRVSIRPSAQSVFRRPRVAASNRPLHCEGPPGLHKDAPSGNLDIARFSHQKTSALVRI